MPVTEQATTPNTILLIGHGRLEEGPADDAIVPGDAVKLTPTGYAVGFATEMTVAKEDALQGKGIDDAYAMGDIVSVHVPMKGDVLNGRAAAAQTVAIGDEVGFNATGQVAGTGTGLVALSAVTGSTLGDRITVRVA